MLRMEPSAACNIPRASGKPAGAQGKYGEFPPLIHLPRCCFEKRGMDMARMPDGRTLRHCPDVMDITEMCRVLDISTKTGYRLLKNGDISSLKIGRAYRIPKAHLLAYLKIRKVSRLW